MNTLTICRENHDNRLLPFLFEIVGQQSEKVVFKNVGNTKKQFCVNIFLFEYEVHICPATVQLVRQPSRTPPLLHKHLFYCMTDMYIESFFHKKGVNCSLICLYISRLRPSYLCTTSTNQFTPQRELRLVILVHEIWSYFEKRIKSVKLRKILCYNILCHIQLFVSVKLEIKSEFVGGKRKKLWKFLC